MDELSPSARPKLSDLEQAERREDVVIGRAIQTSREARVGMTRERLAADANLTMNYLVRIEEGNAIISNWALVRIARALGFDRIPAAGAQEQEISAAAGHLRQHFLQCIQTPTSSEPAA